MRFRHGTIFSAFEKTKGEKAWRVCGRDRRLRLLERNNRFGERKKGICGIKNGGEKKTSRNWCEKEDSSEERMSYKEV